MSENSKISLRDGVSSIVYASIIVASTYCIWLLVLGNPSEELKQQAVERGYAEWHLIHAHSGETEFRWLDKPKDSLPADH